MKVFIIAALTVDGFIGRDSSHVADWTPTEDKAFFKKVTKDAGVVVFGSRTFDTIGRALPGRKTVIYTSRPENYSGESLQPTNVSPQVLVSALADEGYSSVAICGGQQVYELFMASGLVDELYLTTVPILFGKGINLFAHHKDQELTLLETIKLNDSTIVQHYACK